MKQTIIHKKGHLKGGLSNATGAIIFSKVHVRNTKR